MVTPFTQGMNLPQSDKRSIIRASLDKITVLQLGEHKMTEIPIDQRLSSQSKNRTEEVASDCAYPLSLAAVSHHLMIPVRLTRLLTDH